MTYRACFHIPSDLTAVMAADKITRTITGDMATEEFEMNFDSELFICVCREHGYHGLGQEHEFMVNHQS